MRRLVPSASLSLFLIGILPSLAQAAGEPSGEIFVAAPPVMYKAAVEIDGKPVGMLPAQQHLLLPPGPHELSIMQGRWKLVATVTVRAGISAMVRWPRLGPGQVSYQPTLGLVFEPPSSAPEFKKAALASIHRARYSVLGERGVPVEEVHQAECGKSPGCLSDLAETHGLRHVLALELDPMKNGYSFAARLFDAETGDIAGESRQTCAGCNKLQAGQRLSLLCDEVLKRGFSRPLGLLEVTSQPSEAEVLVDGRRRGVTPFRRSASPGEHTIVVHKTGYFDYQNSVDVLPGKGSALDAVLHPLTPTSAPAEPAPPPARQTKVSERRPSGL